MKTTLGGKRLGSGKKMDVSMPDYGWSNHDLSYVWRAGIPCGVAIPSMKKLALPGDVFKINLNAAVKTRPTNGPLYGSFEFRTSLFTCPIRLYQGLLHNNKVAIGTKMNMVKLPLIAAPNYKAPNGSNILHFLNCKGDGAGTEFVYYNAVPYLAYYDICKNYLINKQEENAKVIAAPDVVNVNALSVTGVLSGNSKAKDNEALNFVYMANEAIVARNTNHGAEGDYNPSKEELLQEITYGQFTNENGYSTKILCEFKKDFGSSLFGVWFNLIAPSGLKPAIIKENMKVTIAYQNSPMTLEIAEAIESEEYQYMDDIRYSNYRVHAINQIMAGGEAGYYVTTIKQTGNFSAFKEEIKIEDFPIENLDKAREIILENNNLGDIVYIIKDIDNTRNDLINFAPYNAAIKTTSGHGSNEFPLVGLMLTTYKSDINNNWLMTESIDGESGVAAMTAIDITDEKFYLDTLNLKQKLYNANNRVLSKGNTYEDWCEAIYDENSVVRAESPIYEGGISGNIVFEEVVSTAETQNGTSGNNPLGTLGGRGTLQGLKNGEIEIKVKEPSYIIAITTITPNIDYSQGTDWDMLQVYTLDDLHKPELDGIGFQNLMAYTMNGQSKTGKNTVVGKQPAYIQYMTSVNECHGSFAEESQDLFMTLNRRYENNDYTTYIHPEKFNYAFAESGLAAQNFWVQIGFNIEARRKMSAKIIPNL